mmetsp:Transcript_85355/g.275482  ORF Transcript_85355/g.275482 Transcript_85355/m.275482 type:complete len:271 (+) Transcript_85355:560-1372(+)
MSEFSSNIAHNVATSPKFPTFSSSGTSPAFKARWPKRGCKGNLANSRPCSVKMPLSSTAPIHFNVCTAYATEASGGGVGHDRVAMLSRATPQPINCRTVSVKSTSEISGTSASFKVSPSLHNLRQRPSRNLPARPARCAAEALEMATVSRTSMPLSRLKRERRRRPESMTAVTPGTVIEASATFVDKMTRRRFAGPSRTAMSCSSGGSDPCNGNTSVGRGGNFGFTTSFCFGSPNPVPFFTFFFFFNDPATATTQSRSVGAMALIALTAR